MGEALDAIADGKPRLLEFGVTDEQAWEVGLACGGKVQVFVERYDEARSSTNFTPARGASGRSPWRRGWPTAPRRWCATTRPVATSSSRRNSSTRSRAACVPTRAAALESSGGELFARCYASAPRMVIVGAVHIAQALAPMAAMAGFEVIVIDPRRAFATDGAPARRDGDDGVAGRGAGAHRPRCADRGGDALARSQARRSGADRRAAKPVFLHRRAGQLAHPRQARGAAHRSRAGRSHPAHPCAGRAGSGRALAGGDCRVGAGAGDSRTPRCCPSP